MSLKNPPDNAPNALTPKPESLPAYPREDAGMGVSFDPRDQDLSLITLTQTGSPRSMVRDPLYEEGAVPGRYHLRNAIVPNVDSVLVIPVDMQHADIEWRPNRGGFVARHATTPTDLVETYDETKHRTVQFRSSTKNIIEHAREHYVLADVGGAWQPYLFPCPNSKGQFSRRWQTRFHQYKHPESGGVLPSFARKYRLISVPAKDNAGHTWFAPDFEDDLGWTSAEEYAQAREFYQRIQRGTARGDYRGEYADAT
jgi:hypothetical protein